MNAFSRLLLAGGLANHARLSNYSSRWHMAKWHGMAHSRLLVFTHHRTLQLRFRAWDLLDPLLRQFYFLFSKALFVARILSRMVVLAFLFAPCAVSFPIWYLAVRHDLQLDRPPKKVWWVNYFIWTLEVAGPTWIKIGQWASSRIDLFPGWFCHALSKLQTNVSPHSFYHTRHIVESALGQKLESVFDEFGHRPIGVGAVAQVYKARLKGSEQEVAVKVLHPNVRSLVELDLTIMYSAARIIEVLVPESHWVSFPEEVHTFGTMMHQQLDLMVEAKNLEKFKTNFADWPSVDFPGPSHPSYRDVLIETWLDGIPMNTFLRWKNSCFDREIAKIGLTSFLKMLILDNHVHADLHPGNIIVTFQNDENKFLSRDRVKKLNKLTTESEWVRGMEELREEGYSPYVFYIDAGLTTSLSPKHLSNFIDLFKAVTEFDGSLISRLMVERSESPGLVIDFEGFSASMQSFMGDIKHSALKLKQIEVSDILGFVFSIVRKHHVKLDSEFANIAVALLLVEGIGQQLEPDMDLLKASRDRKGDLGLLEIPGLL
ncbi:hypothetical protein HDV03_001140 [Kappamyces sp. JEL0829]|nr:hypothetical protein HDV03_001140 [Kappamyces sp. JEL0829]